MAMSLALGNRPLSGRLLRLWACTESRTRRSTNELNRYQWSAGRRHIRTGFFPEDDDYIDPESPLLAERVGSRWRYMDDPSLKAPVLERNNVGMGMLVFNRPEGLDLPAINTAYTRLRNLEVNTFKRFVGLTAREDGEFCVGIKPSELLLASASHQRRGCLPHFSRAILWHNQELAHLIGDYRKPLVCYLSSTARNSGAALATLTNFSGAHEDSEIVVDACSMGLVPDGGMTFVLGRLKWNLGEFLALTGTPVRGVDLIYCELIQHWMSPEALPFLELTSEKQLEVSETDARAMLDEHSLPVPDVSQDDFLSRFNLPLIKKAFGHESLSKIETELKDMHRSGSTETKAFADYCLECMAKSCPLAMSATLRLIQDARTSMSQREIGRNGGARLWEIPGLIEETHLIHALRLELRAQQRLLERSDVTKALHARCLGRELSPGDWSHKTIDVVKHDIDDLLKEPSPGDLVDFSIAPRSEMTLSLHPKLRRYHPDYDPVTKTDHDPAWMEAEVRRWSPDYFEEQRLSAIEDMLDGADPAMYGYSRWVRPGTRSHVQI